MKKIGDLAKMMKESFEEKGVHLIDVPIDYTENKTILIDELKQLTCEL